MRIAKKVLSRGTGEWIGCAWFECDRPGFELYKLRGCDHDKRLPCEGQEHVWYVFCTERHRQYFRNSHKRNGMWNLPPGFKKVSY